MTLAEQREKLIGAMDHAFCDLTDLPDLDRIWVLNQLLAAISAAGFSIVGPLVTEEMERYGNALLTNRNEVDIVFREMLAAGDLARKSE